MPYLVQGNAQQLARVFNVQWLVNKDTESAAAIIKKDLPRTSFLGSLEDAEHYRKIWEEKARSEFYTQGNMSAANAYLYLRQDFLFKKDNESDEDYKNNQQRLSFTYLNDKNESCGCMLLYRKDDLSQWFIAVSTNNAALPQERSLTLLASCDLNPFVVHPDKAITVLKFDQLALSLQDVGSSFVQQFLKRALQSEIGTIDPKVVRIKYLLRKLDPELEFKPSDPINFKQITAEQLFTENKALELLTTHQVPLSFRILLECLSEKSGIHDEVEALSLTDTETVVPCLMKMVVHFHETKILAQFRELLNKHYFAPTANGLVWTEEQIKLAPFLMKNYRSLPIDQILSEGAYYNAILELIDLGLSQDIPLLFSNPEKLAQLHDFEKNNDSDLKQLALIFWVKADLSAEEYQNLIKAAKTYPLMAKTLVLLDKTAEYSIQDLKDLVLNPTQHLQQAILLNFKSDFPINDSSLTRLSAVELQRLTQSYMVLRGLNKVGGNLHYKLLQNTPQGDLLRLFIPHFILEPNLEYRADLINFLFIGIQKGPISLDIQIATLTDDKLKKEALKLIDRICCAKQMQQLGFNDEYIVFAANPRNSKASHFRSVVLQVEAQCKKIQQHLLSSNVYPQHKNDWQAAEKEYRKSLYKIAFEALNNPDFDLKPHLKKTQKKVLALVDPEIKSWVQKALIIIANVFISALTLGIANEYKYRKTGNYWFFNQTSSGEKLRALEKDFINLLVPTNSPK